jgi:multiple antibiotic resistance protein
MGFEMLYGGQSSRAQGTREAEAMAPEDDGLVLPLTVPLMAGPGAITTVISVSTLRDDGSSIAAAVVAVAVVAVLIFVGFAFLSGLFARMKPSAMAMVARIGGLFLATIGVQLVLGGIRTFYET